MIPGCQFLPGYAEPALWLLEHSRSLDVLNTFAYTGSWGWRLWLEGEPGGANGPKRSFFGAGTTLSDAQSP
jgi:hypothetical protein